MVHMYGIDMGKKIFIYLTHKEQRQHQCWSSRRRRIDLDRAVAASRRPWRSSRTPEWQPEHKCSREWRRRPSGAEIWFWIGESCERS